MKIVISRRFGGFSLSQMAFLRLRELEHPTALAEDDRGDDRSYCRDIQRNDLQLVQVVEELGEKADGRHAKLVVVDIPDGVEWTIQDYDGREWVAEKHRTW